jgi:hypothetical protein
MKNILDFNIFVNEEYKRNTKFDVKLSKLIDNDGNVLDKTGWAVEYLGIVDEDGNAYYMAGVSELDNTFYVNISVTEKGVEGCLNVDNKFYPIEAGAKYNGEEKIDAQ